MKPAAWFSLAVAAVLFGMVIHTAWDSYVHGSGSVGLPEAIETLCGCAFTVAGLALRGAGQTKEKDDSEPSLSITARD